VKRRVEAGDSGSRRKKKRTPVKGEDPKTDIHTCSHTSTKVAKKGTGGSALCYLQAEDCRGGERTKGRT